MYKRHVFFYTILRPIVGAFLFLRFGYRYKKVRNLPDNYIVLSNHVTDYDPLFVGVCFPRHMYFVASEHISRWKFAYKLIQYVLKPIMRPKGTTASSTVMEMIRTLRNGINVCLYPEGARSWDGVTAPILASTGKMVKSAKCGMVTFRIEGGYFVSPNWSFGNSRKGRIRGGVVNVYTPEQIASMSVDEINEAITGDLHEDAYERQLASPVKYRGKNLAQCMENMISHCPGCNAIDALESKGNEVKCNKCGQVFSYDEYGMLNGIPYKTVKELFEWQKHQIEKDAESGVTYTAPDGTLTTLVDHIERPISEGAIYLNREQLVCGDKVIPLKDITDMAMHGRRTLVFSTAKEYYELIPVQSANALKFHMLYQMYKNGRIDHYNGRTR